MHRILFIVFSLLYLSATLTSAFTKELWFDEIVSVYVDRLPAMRDVWAALASSADAMPPLFHLFTRACRAVIANEAMAARLPATVGYWVMCLSVWLFLRHRMSPVYAWMGLVPALLPTPFYFATEGRAYGVAVGFSGLALLCWQRRKLVLFVLMLAAAVSSHYYAVFLVIPFGLAELALWRKDAPRWAWIAALATPVIPIAVHLPLIRAADVYRADAWAAPRVSLAVTYYLDFVAGIGPAIVFGLAVAGLAGIVMRSQPADEPGLMFEERALAAGFLVIPLAVLASSLLVTHTYFPRYAMPSTIGFMLAAAEALRASRMPTSVVLCGVMLAVLGAQKLEEVRANWNQLPTAADVAAALDAGPGPAVIEEPVTFLKAHYYAPGEGRARLTSLADPVAAIREVKLGNPDLGLLQLRSVAPVTAVPPEEFFAENRRFQLLVNPTRPDWVLQELRKRGAALEVRRRLPSFWVLQVSFPDSKSDASQ